MIGVTELLWEGAQNLLGPSPDWHIQKFGVGLRVERYA